SPKAAAAMAAMATLMAAQASPQGVADFRPAARIHMAHRDSIVWVHPPALVPRGVISIQEPPEPFQAPTPRRAGSVHRPTAQRRPTATGARAPGMRWSVSVTARWIPATVPAVAR